MLLFEATLTRYLGNGPMYPQQGFEIDMCKSTWWTNLLYVNNLIYVDKMVIFWSFTLKFFFLNY